MSKLIALACSVLLLLWFSSPASAQSLEIGFDGIEPNEAETLLASRLDIFGEAVRSAVFSSLVKTSEETSEARGNFELLLSDKVESNLADRSWTFHLRSGARFHSGRYITALDIESSLLECSALKASEPQISTSERLGAGQMPDVTIKVGLPPITKPDISYQERSEELWILLTKLSKCPIFSIYERKIFGSSWGQGSNIVAAGPYYIAGFNNSGTLELKRSPHFVAEPVKSELVVLRTFKNGSAGLSALRVGTLSILFTEDQQIHQLASKDETLRSGTCLNSGVIYRRDVVFKCAGGIELSKITFSG